MKATPRTVALLTVLAIAFALSGCSPERVTPLMKAARKGDRATVERLIQQGANVNARDIYHNPVLYYAVWKGNGPVVELLVQHGADVNFPVKTRGDMRPLHLAASASDSQIVQILCRHGARVNDTDESGCTPLYQAVMTRSPKVVSALLEHDADPNIRHRSSGMTPLEIARVVLAEHPDEKEYRPYLVIIDLLEAPGAKEKTAPESTRSPSPTGKKNEGR